MILVPSLWIHQSRTSSSGTLTYEPAAPGTFQKNADGETVGPMLQIVAR